MNAYVERIAEKLVGENKKVILYCADTDALVILRELKRRNIVPTCLCDSDRMKWHKSLMGVEILPPDEAFDIFPDAYYYITNGLYKHQIIGYLLTGGKLAPDRILNYEPVEKRTSCVYLENHIVCAGHRLQFCCSDFGKNTSPNVHFDGDYDKSVDEFIAYRDQLTSDLNHGVPTPCDGCPCIKEDWYARERKIMMYNNGEAGVCNFDCCYCNSPGKKTTDVSGDIGTKEMISVLKKRDLLSEELHTVIGCGEVTVHPRRGEIYESISGYRNTICTNASVRDKGLLRLLELGRSDLVVSVDAGTRETFLKVKGYDLFDEVSDNLKLYGSVGIVKLKYIFLPGVNDNKADIDGFIALCRDIGTSLVQISYNLHAPPDLTEQTKSTVRYMIEKLTENELLYRIISDVIYKAVY